MFKKYSDAEIFISLNETESFGITYVEALLSGCKIICPKTGGQVEFLCNYPDRVQFVDLHSQDDIATAIKYLLETPTKEIDSDQLIDKFSYKNTASVLLQ